MSRYPLLIIFTLLFSLNAASQTKHPPARKPARRQAVHATQHPVLKPRFIAIDSPIIVPPLITRIDTTKKDTATFVEKVADIIHDSVKAQIKAPVRQVPVTLKSLIVPGVLFAYGALTLNNGGLRSINREARTIIWDGEEHHHPYLEDYTLLVPAAAVYGLNIFGVKGRNNLVDRSIIYGMSNAIANGMGFGLKKIGIETRPDSSDHYSFPSGHTAEAFVSAEFLHQEYKGRIHWSVIALGYGVGIGTAYLRILHNKHWLSDVVAGAGVGIASTRFSYYLYPILKHVLFGSKTVRGSAMFLPTYSNGMVGLAGVWQFR